ncbi:MAG: lysine--tRNA ligase [Candidatus Algichlamydia australiensis]|nr:lysine--tRNA ligase [Chlamydiales bacterium]
MANPLPDYFRWDDFKKRSEKLAEIRASGMNPYPHKYSPTHAIRDLNSKYEKEELADSEAAASGTTPESCVAGRLMLFRAMGKNAFAHLQEEGERVQVMFNRDHTTVCGLPDGESAIKFIEKKIDLGDIIGVSGHLFRTQKGELTLYAKEVTLLTKSLLPLPDKHHGLTDKGTRYRKRWLDLITNKQSIETFKVRSKILSTIRKTMEETKFLEVENPVLQNMYGGAEARPFVSHLNALNLEMFLRISLELPLKKLIVGGFERVYELAKVFRNEGIDRTHNPEFTMLEAYAAYWDYNDVMDFVEKIFEDVALALFGTTQIGMRKDKEGKEHAINLQRPWKRITMKDSIQEYANINVEKLSDEQIRKTLSDKSDLEQEAIDNAPRGKLIAMLFEELVEHHLIQPTHIIDHPIETTPLCKLHRNPKEREEQIVERFETFILGFEFCNAYTELNDPEIQRQLLVQQNEKREAGDEEASPLDEEFLEAICQGMPPTGGFGIGIDRLTMLFTGETSIRDVVFFPVMRPEE